MVDIHTHLLFGVDDGPKTVEESIEMIRDAKKIGFNEFYLTAHYNKGRFCNNNYDRNYEILKVRCEELGLGVKLHKGNEVYLDENIEKVLLPNLLDRRVNKLDYIIVSHFDADHATGVAQILGKIDVSSIILTRQLEENDIYRHILSIAKEKKIKLIYVKEGDVLKIGGIKISIIHPENKLMINNPMNNNSIVCKVEYNSFSMLLTGDIEMEAEELILRKNINLKADVLKVAHHGSKTSTTGEFLKAINPKVALIGVGKNNNFGHPSNEVIQRLKENGTRIYRTDENGEISITVNKKGRIIKIQRCIT